MKTTKLALILFLTAPGLWAQTPAPAPASPMPMPGKLPVAHAATAPEKEVAGYSYNFQGVDVNQVLDEYAKLVGRTQLRAGLPNVSIVLKTQSPLTKTEAIEALQAVLALNGIAVVNIGDKFVKVLTPEQANSAGGEFNDLPADQLPDLGSYVTHIVQLKYVKPSVMQGIIAPFSRLPNSITAIDDNGILVIRDYAENVKRMLEMIDKIDVSVPAEYISEVIPIRYAKVDDIANALNSLGGSGGATVTIGSSPASTPISGLAGSRSSGTGLGGMGTSTPQTGINTPTSTFGQTRAANPNGTPSSASPFQQRLLNIINRAGSAGGGGEQGPIQLFGQTKIIPNESSSSLLIYATKPDMDAITNIIAKLDVPLAQVLVEAVIVDYTLGNTFNFGVSAAQNPKTIPGSNPQTQVAGGVNNGQTFLNFANSMLSATNASNGVFGNNLGSGLSYFGSIGPTWDLAMQAAQSDSHASIIQRPRIQTSQAVPAQFFVGSSVPYITGNYSYAGQSQNNYSQLSVGVELDVTPFINPEGAVTMQIQQEIDAIDNPNYNNTDQPSTIKRTLNTTITVRDRDTVMLGGFIEADKSHSKSGVPLLSSIPLLGNLFSSRNDSKTRQELIVLMRPTVLGTPELAARNTIKEAQRLPDISATYAEDVEEQSKLIEAERKAESNHPKTMHGGFFNTSMPTNAPADQSPQPQAQGDGFFMPVAPVAPVVPADTNNAAPPQP